MPRGIVERRIHQDDIDAVGSKARIGKCIGARTSTSSTIDFGRDRIGGGIAARQPCQHLDRSRPARDRCRPRAGRPRGPRHRRRRRNRPRDRPTRRRRRREQHGVVTGAVARLQLPQTQLSAEKCVLGAFGQPAQSSARNSWARPASAEDLSRLAVVVLMNQDPARQHAERAFDDAHVLVQHQMMDVGAVEQRADRRNQHDIVGPNQFPQLVLSFAGPACGGCGPVNRFLLLPHCTRQFLLLCQG